jgi:hypothetical protein
MSDAAARVGDGPLQFDRVVTDHAGDGSRDVAVACESCRTTIKSEYYQVNRAVVCERCRRVREDAAETPVGIIPMIAAAGAGLGAGIVGAAIYFAVIAIAHLEIGIVAILIGYMVGYAVRNGAGGRGGLRFQLLAVALTYVSIAMAYTPLAIKELLNEKPRSRAATQSSVTTSDAPAVAAEESPREPSRGALIMGLAFLLAFIAALPVLVVVGSFPSGLISALIMFIGMRQAWIMTRAPVLEIFGPYRVGVEPASAAM